MLARVFGVLHSLFYLTVALGAVLAPPLIHWLGVRWTLVIVGSLLPILAVLTRASLVRLDVEPGDPRRLALLEAIPIFSPLSPPVLEQLAARLTPVHANAGDELIRFGDHGDRFYVVDKGEVEILVDDEPPRREGEGSTSARSRCCATCPAPRLSGPRPTATCSRSTATTSCPP